jgi:ubiquinone/menaquinone biosynthesis C-methylase UbiE
MNAPLVNGHFERVAAGFSRKADAYDAFGPDDVNIARMRRIVREHVQRFLRRTDRILEINAGTGIDAVYFAQLGHPVHAIDIAPAMLDHLTSKITSDQLQSRLTLQALSFTDLDRVERGPFDYLLSNFGGLNCLDDLSLVSRHLPCVLKPNGRLTWVIMPPICPWEIATLLRGQLKIATRRLSRHGTLAHVEGVYFKTYYFTPKHVQHALGKDFRLLRLEGLSVFAPPANRVDFPRHFPRLYRALANIDQRLATRAPFNHWGDFFILTAQATWHG